MAYHPLYRRCCKMVNKKVTLHHHDGQRVHATINRVIPNGLYVTPFGGYGMMSAQDTSLQLHNADQGHEDLNTQTIFFGALFVPFAALAGLTVGFAAGALATRPYYW